MLTLRQLRYLDALARHGNFVRAAEECAISQPALSMQIRELEQELGAELVARGHGATALTEAGAEVARRASSILSATRDLDVAIDNSKGLPEERMLQTARTDAFEALKEALQSDRYWQWFDGMWDWVGSGPWSTRQNRRAAQRRTARRPEPGATDAGDGGARRRPQQGRLWHGVPGL